MVAYLGNLNLWFCLCFAIFQFVNSINTKYKSIVYFNKIAAIGLLLCSLISFFSLMYSHIISDFSLINVFQNSHTTKPLLYKISGVWGSHEGSMLLWILVLTIFNYFILKLYKSTNLIFVSKALETQALIIFGFVLFTVLTSNPFDKMQDIQLNGMGFNPILQDPALAIHPPLLYIGYVGFSAAFSISIATLTSKNKLIPWDKYMKPFVLAAWTFLTIGITFGSIWAYYELGWGGWWFWDPVENASFMPWLLGTALIHSLITIEKKKNSSFMGSFIINTSFPSKCNRNISCKIWNTNQRTYVCIRSIKRYLYTFICCFVRRVLVIFVWSKVKQKSKQKLFFFF